MKVDRTESLLPIVENTSVEKIPIPTLIQGLKIFAFRSETELSRVENIFSF